MKPVGVKPNICKNSNSTTRKYQHSEYRALVWRCPWRESYLFNHCFFQYLDQIYMYLYVRIYTMDRNNYFVNKTKTSLVAGRQCEDGRGRPRQSREMRARRHTTNKQHTEWRASSRARSFGAQTLASISLIDCSDGRSTCL